MKKKDFLKAAWVPITKRLPPDTSEDVLAWDVQMQRAYADSGYHIREDAEKVLAHDGEKYPTWMHVVSHWMPLIDPDDDEQMDIIVDARLEWIAKSNPISIKKVKRGAKKGQLL